MPRLNSAGSALCGIAGGQISIDGSIPAPLAGYTGGYWGWFDATHVYGPADGGSGWHVYQYQISGSVSLVSAIGPNFFAAGGSVWAAATASSPSVVDTSVGGLGPFSGAYLADVSPDGQTVVIDNYQAGTGLSIYNASGSRILHLPAVTITQPYVRLRDNHLAYQDADGWHLVNVTTGATPLWYPRTDSVVTVVPVLVGSTLMVVELSNNQLTARPASRATGYVVETGSNSFNPDGVATSTAVLRMAYTSTLGEAPDSLIETDLTIATGANERGTVVGGVVVFQPGTPFTLTTFPVGPAEGSDLTAARMPPVNEPVTDARTGDRMTLPWQGWAQAISRDLQTVSGAVQNQPTPPAQAAGFGVINVDTSGQPNVAAFAPNDTLTLGSTDGTVTRAGTPATRTVDLGISAKTDAAGALDGDGSGATPLAVRVDGVTVIVNGSNQLQATAGGGGGWIPLASGTEPPTLVTDASGVLILVGGPN